MNDRIKKIILVLILLAGFAAASLFFTSNKSISFESGKSIIKNEQALSNANAVYKSGNSIKILFLGDLMFDRWIRQVSEKHGNNFVFQKTENLLQNKDLIIGNLEGPITDEASISINSKIGEKNNYIFTFDPKIAGILANENIKLVNIGNNHIFDFGISGVEKTRKYLTKAGIDFFGDPQKRLAIKDINGSRLAFVNFNQFVFGSEQKTLEDIKKAREAKADLIFLYAHWGTEFMEQPSKRIKNLAHEFIDNGVGLIIGSHPHVIQPKEEYKGKIIYYSLGNFIFDQYFDPNTQKGLTVQVEINLIDKKIKTSEYFVKMENDGQTVQE